MTVDPALVDLMRSPGTATPLALSGRTLLDAGGARVGRRVGSVWSFLDHPDAFYEGRYNNRVRHVPRGDGWLATLPLRVVTQSYATTVAAEVPPGSTVVEIGCAGGLSWFGRRYRMIGMDLSRQALQLAAEDYALVVQCDATRMPLADQSVDAVISSCLFEHLTDAQKSALLAEAARVLKPGGKIVFLYDLWTENALITWYRRCDPDRYRRSFLDRDGHLGYRTVAENRRFFHAAGLAITREIFHERTPIQSNSVWQKFSGWPGFRGWLGRIGTLATAGPLRLPMLTLLSLMDATLGRVFPCSHARVMTTVATKR